MGNSAHPNKLDKKMTLDRLAERAANALNTEICSAPIAERMELRTRLERITQRWEIVSTHERGYRLQSECRWSEPLDRYLHEDDAYECTHCSEIMLSGMLSGVYIARLRGGRNEEDWCECCRQDGASICANCGDCWQDDDTQVDGSGDTLCRECYEAREEDEDEDETHEELPAYHAGWRAPLPCNYKLPAYSAELEVEADDRDGLICALRTLAANQSPRWIGWERDGSLNDSKGVELLLSMLPSLDALREALQVIAPIVRRHGGTSWDNGRCGLHINSNCLHWSKLRKARLLYLVHTLRGPLETISGRANAHWCVWPNARNWRDVMGGEFTFGLLAQWRAGHLGKYLCVRMDSQRIEWRMFRGTLRSSRIALYCATVKYLEEQTLEPVHNRVQEIRSGLIKLAAAFGFTI